MRRIAILNQKGGVGKTLDKPCSKCKVVKPLSEFPQDKRKSTGRAAECKSCKGLRERPRRTLANYPVTVTDKSCTKCGQFKPGGAFKRDRLNQTGLSGLCRDCIAANHKRWRHDLRREVLKAYGGTCACCGESQREFLSLDHVRGGGRRHRIALNNNQATLYSRLKKARFPPGEFRILCHNCNQSLGIYGYCPHHGKESVEA